MVTLPGRMLYKERSALPLALVLSNAAFNDLLDLRIIDFIETGRFYTLQKTKRKVVNSTKELSFRGLYILRFSSYSYLNYGGSFKGQSLSTEGITTDVMHAERLTLVTFR